MQLVPDEGLLVRTDFGHPYSIGCGRIIDPDGTLLPRLFEEGPDEGDRKQELDAGLGHFFLRLLFTGERGNTFSLEGGGN